MPCVLEDAICRVLTSGEREAGLSRVCPRWKGAATSQSCSFGALGQWDHSEALQICF